VAVMTHVSRPLLPLTATVHHCSDRSGSKWGTVNALIWSRIRRLSLRIWAVKNVLQHSIPQPGMTSAVGICGRKKPIPTVCARLKRSEGEIVIDQSGFGPEEHERLDA
jgi:hypothetical protein